MDSPPSPKPSEPPRYSDRGNDYSVELSPTMTRHEADRSLLNGSDPDAQIE